VIGGEFFTRVPLRNQKKIVCINGKPPEDLFFGGLPSIQLVTTTANVLIMSLYNLVPSVQRHKRTLLLLPMKEGSQMNDKYYKQAVACVKDRVLPHCQKTKTWIFRMSSV